MKRSPLLRLDHALKSGTGLVILSKTKHLILTHKRLSGGALIVGLSFLLWHHLVLSAITPPPAPPTLTENTLIVAPATVDPLSDLIRIPAPQAGLIQAIFVKVGDEVKAGMPLFSLKNDNAKMQVNVYKIALAQAQTNLQSQAKDLLHAKVELEKLKSLDKRAVARVELREKQHLLHMKKMLLKQTKQSLAMAKTNLKNAEDTLAQYTVYAPKDGLVLQVNAHVNEYANWAQPIVLLGDATKMMVRVSIDERDAHRFSPQAQAYITNAQNPDLKIPLEFVQLDKYITTLERFNTRVQEVVYCFNRKDYPQVVSGQQFDTYITL